MQIQSLIYYSCIILINSILLSEFCAEKNNIICCITSYIIRDEEINKIKDAIRSTIFLGNLCLELFLFCLQKALPSKHQVNDIGKRITINDKIDEKYIVKWVNVS